MNGSRLRGGLRISLADCNSQSAHSLFNAHRIRIKRFVDFAPYEGMDANRSESGGGWVHASQGRSSHSAIEISYQQNHAKKTVRKMHYKFSQGNTVPWDYINDDQAVDSLEKDVHMQSQASKQSQLLDDVFRNDYQWLANKLRYRVGCPYSAEDVASESFSQLAAMPELETLREPRAMLTTIANRVLYNIIRRRNLEHDHLHTLAQAPEALHPSPEEQHLLLESLTAVEEALEGLSSKARKAFIYSQLDGLTYAQIGEKLGVSASMVRQYIAKALKLCYRAANEP